jgi:hypothetical protein
VANSIHLQALEAQLLLLLMCTHVLPPQHPQIQFLSDCDHPNVVRYLGSFRLPDALWIVMEHCGGGSVGDLLQVRAGMAWSCGAAKTCAVEQSAAGGQGLERQQRLVL